ncbi:type II toxin-antitoxin system death-on-curing family toxin [Picosynechococcus sp. NKBG15041c]|uniref:type II toxin-antitoxin system death-on-curing family toxin n=1 Tax=Picosynechococcus sp. NKBG15041c TaxID=1407650 RepID=UPI0004173227|nr:type II toxin-antitoxin system death-on-curing family toxin [Picosynechococcus sp. NKBG15041c]
MKEPTWLNGADIYEIHKEIIAIFGGQSGILNPGLIISSLNKAKNLFHYTESPDLCQLAAVYGYGLIKNHCFLDGNKQVSLIAVYTFLAINGFELIAPEQDVIQTFSDLAGTQASQAAAIETFAQWLRQNTHHNH